MRKRPQISENKFDSWADNLKSWISESVSPFEDDTPAKQEARIERGRYDLLYFCTTYLPHYFTIEFGDFHEEWEEISETKDDVELIAAPREHAKSTFWSFAIPIRNSCYALRRFQLIISDTNDQAVGFTLPIKLELEDNPRLRHDFGDLKGTKWASGDFVTTNGVKVLARGKGEKVRGLKNRQYRPDYAVVDDIENDENVENPKIVKKTLRWLRRAVIGSMGTGYLFVMVGNLFHPKSVLSQLVADKDEEGNLLYSSHIYRAWLDYGKSEQRPLFPALWPPERLEKKKRTMGTRDFNAEMMNLTGDDDSPFQENWFVYFDRLEIPKTTLEVATFVDPSAKNGENNDFKGIITVGLDRQKMIIRCLHAHIRRVSVGDMFKAIYAQHATYGGVVGIEENMLKDFLHEAIYNYAKDVGKYLPWMPVHHSTNKEARIIGSLSYLVEHQKLQFEKGHSDQDMLVEQLIYILNKNINDDGPDALEGAVSLIQHGSTGDEEIHSADPRETEQMLEGYM
jgi:hypothetical protein